MSLTYIDIHTDWPSPIISHGLGTLDIQVRKAAEVVIRINKHRDITTTALIKLKHQYYRPGIPIDIDRDITVLLLGATPVNFINRLTAIVNDKAQGCSMTDTFIYINPEWDNPVVISKYPNGPMYADIILRTLTGPGRPSSRVIKHFSRLYNPSIIVDIPQDITVLLLGAIPVNFADRLTTTIINKEVA